MFYGNGTARLVREFRLAGSGRRRVARSRLASARYLPVLVRRHRGQVPVRRRPPLREPRAGSRRHHREHVAPAPRAGNDAADVAQPFHLRHPGRARLARTSSRCANGARRCSPSARACCRAAGRRKRPITLVQDDPTWALEYAHFKACAPTARRPICRTTSGSIACWRASAPRRQPRRGRSDEPPVVGFAGMTHLGLVSASAVAGARLRGRRAIDADRALIDAWRGSNGRCSSPASTS